jgi:hypothetical protein
LEDAQKSMADVDILEPNAKSVSQQLGGCATTLVVAESLPMKSAGVAPSSLKGAPLEEPKDSSTELSRNLVAKEQMVLLREPLDIS